MEKFMQHFRQFIFATLSGLGLLLVIYHGVANDSTISENLNIVDYGPSGDLPIENRRPIVFVMFNNPMIPLAQLSIPQSDSEIMMLTPQIPGVFRWMGTRTLGFIPEKAMLEHPRYRVTVSGTATALNGSRLGKDFSFEIIGERLKIVDFYAGNKSSATARYAKEAFPKTAQRITLEFNQPVDPDTIASGLEITIDSLNIKFTVSRPDFPESIKTRTSRAVLLSLDQIPPENSYINIALKAGTSPLPGFPGSKSDQKVRIYTLDTFAFKKLIINQYHYPRYNGPFELPINLVFSNNLDPNQTPDKISVKLDGIPIEVDNYKILWDYIEIKLPNTKPGMLIEVKIPEGIKDRYGHIAYPVSQSIRIPRPYPLLTLPHEIQRFSHLEAQFIEGGLIWAFRNIQSGTVGIGNRTSYYPNNDYSPTPKTVDFTHFPKDIVHYRLVDIFPWMNPDGYGTVFMNFNLVPEPITEDYNDIVFKHNIAVQITDLGITVRAAQNRVLVWVNRLSDGSPVKNADVTLLNPNGVRISVITDRNGLVAVPFEPGMMTKTFSFEDTPLANNNELIVRAEKDGDLAELKVSNQHYVPWFFRHIYPDRTTQNNARIYFFTDRNLYMPGDELAIRGFHWNQYNDGFASYIGPYEINLFEEFKKTSLIGVSGKTSESGGFFNRFRLPKNISPGIYRMLYRADDTAYEIAIRIGNFNRVNFQIKAEAVQSHYIIGDSLEMEVNAKHLSSGALSDAPYQFFWRRQPEFFKPPGTEWESWSFGTDGWAAEGRLDRGEGKLSASGVARLTTVARDQPIAGSAYRYFLETTVADVDHRVISATADTLVHPASVYVAARFEGEGLDGWWSRFVPTGKSINAQAMLVDWNGNSRGSEESLTFQLFKISWESTDRQGLSEDINTRWEKVETEQWQKDVNMINGKAELTFSVAKSGEYALNIDYIDTSEKLARTRIQFYVTGSGWVNRVMETPEKIQLTPDKELYEPGETARILVQSPVEGGRYLLTLEREGLLEEKIIVLDGSLTTIEVPVVNEYLPHIFVSLSSFTSRNDQIEPNFFKPDLGKPRSLYGITEIMVSSKAKELNVDTVNLPDSYRPGQEAEFILTVSKNGKPVSGAEVTLLVVDRGVLDLMDYHVPNPLEYIYTPNNFPLAVIGDDSRNLLIRPVTYSIANLQGGGGDLRSKAYGHMNLNVNYNRSNFNPLAVFEPEALTDSNGQVRIKAVLPDSLSTYRLTAIAVHDFRLGYIEDEFIVKNPVNVRTNLPQIFRIQDTVMAGLVLTNTIDQSVTLVIKAESDLLKFTDDSEKTVILKPNASLELPFRITATQPGNGEIRFSISSEVLTETLVEPIIVEVNNLKEAISTTGIIRPDKPVEERIKLPETIESGESGNLTISINSSVKPWIQESIRQLLEPQNPGPLSDLYRIAGKIIENDSPESLKKDGETVLKKLAGQEIPSGGLYYSSSQPQPSQDMEMRQPKPNWFLTALAIHVAGQLTNHLDTTNVSFNNPLNMDTHYDYLKERLTVDETERKRTPHFLHAWSAWLLSSDKHVDANILTWLYNAKDELGIGGCSLLANTLLNLNQQEKAEALYKFSKKYMTIGTRSVSIKDTYEHQSYFSSKHKELALFLHSAVQFNETANLIMLIADALRNGRNNSYSYSGFDNFWIVTAFHNLIRNNTITGMAPDKGYADFHASLAGIPIFTEQSKPNEHLDIKKIIPLSRLMESGQKSGTLLPLTLEQRGEGALYYAATLTYSIPVETATARDEGIEVVRTYETPKGKILEPDNLPIGKPIRIRVNISTLKDRSYLNLSVPLPSGIEILNSDYATTGQYTDLGGVESEIIRIDGGYGDIIEREHNEDWTDNTIKQIYGNSVTYTWLDFPAGNREISMLVQTIIPGTFFVPPASASLEFEPEVFGRENGMLVIIRGE